MDPSTQRHFWVRFEPSGKRVLVPEGSLLTAAASQAGLALDQVCGGQAHCGRCRVIVRHPEVPFTPADKAFFTPEELEEGWRLGCQLRITADMVVEIPASSLAYTSAQILAAHGDISLRGQHLPVQKVHVVVPPASREHPQADVDRLEHKLGRLQIPLELLRQLPLKLAQCGGSVTAVLEVPSGNSRLDLGQVRPDLPSGGSFLQRVTGESALQQETAGNWATVPTLLELELGNTCDRHFGVAIDIGTTTLVAALVDLVAGCPVATATGMNPQIQFGDDVISRIQYTREHPEGLAALQEGVVSACSDLINHLCQMAGIRPEEVFVVTCSGNTTMLHLLLGLPVANLGEAPYVPVFSRGLQVRARDAGFQIHPNGHMYIFPIIGGFVGGDIVAGILTTRLWEQEGPVLLVDIGTNGEIVLAFEGRMHAAATAAGPAFEGARIRHGMRAVPGAIERMTFFDGELGWQVIGQQKPAGICGSGLVDLLAELLRHGIVDRTGRLREPGELPPDLSPNLKTRVLPVEGRSAFLVVPGEQTASGHPIFLTQHDVRQLQLAAGAIRAGIRVLCAQFGVEPTQLKHVWVAGAFGNYLRPENAQTIGLLPKEIPSERIRFVGNTSLAGAIWAAGSLEARQLAQWIAARTLHVDLAAEPAFRQAFMEAMFFPEPAGASLGS